jgi:hypothetical protein
MPALLRHRWIFLAQIVAVCSLPASSFAQQPRGPQLPAPPPMRFVSRDERSQLSAARDSKSRLRTTIELAETHLARAEESTSQKKFDQASEEIGRYLGLIDDARQVLGTLVRDKNSTRDLYRRFDIVLRAHVPRLAVMRRTTPADLAVHIKTAEEFARDTRTEALESFYGHSVLREDNDNQKKADKPKDSPEVIKRP